MKDRAEILEAMEQPGFDYWRDDAGRDAFDHVLASWHGDWASANREWQAACEMFDRNHAPEEFHDDEAAL